MPDDLSTSAENTWCPGCGNFGILSAFKKAVIKLEERGIDHEHLVISSGIGCHGKIFDYLRLNGLYFSPWSFDGDDSRDETREP